MDSPTRDPAAFNWSDRPLHIERWFTCWVLLTIAWLIAFISVTQEAVESGGFAFAVHELLARSPSEALALDLRGLSVTLATITFLTSPLLLWVKRRRKPDAWNAIAIGCMLFIWMPPLTNSYVRLKQSYLSGYFLLAIAYTITAVSIILCSSSTDRDRYCRFRRRSAIRAMIAVGIGIVAAGAAIVMQVAPFAFARVVLSNPLNFVLLSVMDPVVVIAHLLFYGGVITGAIAIYRLAKAKLPKQQSADATPRQHGFPVIVDQSIYDQ